MSSKGISDCSHMEGSLSRGHVPGQCLKHDAVEHNVPVLRSGPTSTRRGLASYVVSHKAPRLRLVCFTRTTLTLRQSRHTLTLHSLCGTHMRVHTHLGSSRSVGSATASSCHPAHHPPSSVLLLEAGFSSFLRGVRKFMSA